jgi:hypothetical protein
MTSVSGKTAIFRRGDPDAPNKLAIATCTLGLVRVERDVMFMAAGMPLGQACGFVFTVGYGIQDARNIAWNAAESQGWEYFMFWDDDVVPHAFGYVEMLLETMEQNPEIDILGGVYPARQGAPAPIVLKEKAGSPWWGWEDGGIHQVWMTGTGFTMYRMSSMKKLSPPAKTINTLKGPWSVKQLFRLEDGTDDVALAVEAEEAGLTWYVHGAAVCDQIEPTGERYEIDNARHRITPGGASNGAGESANPARADDRRPARIRAG